MESSVNDCLLLDLFIPVDIPAIVWSLGQLPNIPRDGQEREVLLWPSRTWNEDILLHFWLHLTFDYDHNHLRHDLLESSKTQATV